MGSELSEVFLQHLWRLQAEAGISDAELARRMGHERSYISRLKSETDKTRNVSLSFAVRAVRLFPELRGVLDSFLPQEVSEFTESLGTLTDAPQEGGQR